MIALALTFGFARKYTYIFTTFSALVIWGIAEGFGGPYNGSSTDIGAAVMYAVVAVGLLVLSQYPRVASASTIYSNNTSTGGTESQSPVNTITPTQIRQAPLRSQSQSQSRNRIRSPQRTGRWRPHTEQALFGPTQRRAWTRIQR
jgi:hypothetical protein